ncbi:MAG: SulP family inorganic anion transporter [Akkermansiaceae bacterium]|jgi:SulP family sulfate permease|nr:SulP family inorganic anion transporter [Akkermansiaceae bacterium]
MKERKERSWVAALGYRPKSLELLSGKMTPAALGKDVMAGLTVGMIALPLALALGIASVPAGQATPFPAPALGIFTAIIAGFLISALGGSRVQIGGPTAAFIPIILLVIEKHGYAGLLMATVMAGVILVIMGLAKMGSLIKYIPWPVTSGFTTGIAVAIIATQTGDFLGIHTDEPAPREFIERLHWLGNHFPDMHLPSVLLAVGCLAVIVFWPRLGFRRVPGSIVAMIGATVLVAAFGWQENPGISTIGSKFGSAAIPAGLPAVSWPHFEWAMMRDLIGPATAIALLGAIESLLSAVVADGLTGGRHDSNTELVAQGIANIVCPFFGGLPATGAIARTSANVNNGGRTPLAGMVHALTLLGIILLFAKWAVYVPLAAMSAVLVFVALRMGEWHELRRLGRMPLSDAAVLVTTFALTVIFDLVIAVEVGMVLAAILFIKRVSETTEVSQVFESDVLESPEQLAGGKEIPEGVRVYRIFGPFLFGAAEKMEDALERIGEPPKVLILRLHLVPAMDATALNALESVVERLQQHGGSVILSGLHRQPLEMLRKAGFIDVIGRANLVAHFDDALVRARGILAADSHSAGERT